MPPPPPRAEANCLSATTRSPSPRREQAAILQALGLTLRHRGQPRRLDGSIRSMYFPDLGTETQIASGSRVRAIGWLGAGAEYSRGAVPPEFMERLIRFTRHWGESTRALGWPYACGFHTCEFCGEFNASGNFGVPSTSVLYVCPEMIVHYIAVHEYQPPPEFVDAVLAAPLPGTAPYKRAVEGFRDGEL